MNREEYIRSLWNSHERGLTKGFMIAMRLLSTEGMTKKKALSEIENRLMEMKG